MELRINFKIINQGKKIIRKYTAPDKQLEINHMILNGRTSEKEGEFMSETKIHFMTFVIRGNGKMYVGDEIFEVGRGDCIDIPPGTRFAAKGYDFEYITVENPAWYPDQASIVDKDGNVLRRN